MNNNTKEKITRGTKTNIEYLSKHDLKLITLADIIELKRDDIVARKVCKEIAYKVTAEIKSWDNEGVKNQKHKPVFGSRAMNKGMGEGWSIMALHTRINGLETANKLKSGFPTGQGKLGFVVTTPGSPTGEGGYSSGNSSKDDSAAV